MSDLTKQVGERIRTARKAAGMTQPQLAEAAELSVTFLSLAENGKKGLGLESLAAVSDALNVSADWLLRNNTPAGLNAASDELARELADCTPKEREALLRHLRLMKKTIRELSAENED